MAILQPATGDLRFSVGEDKKLQETTSEKLKNVGYAANAFAGGFADIQKGRQTKKLIDIARPGAEALSQYFTHLGKNVPPEVFESDILVGGGSTAALVRLLNDETQLEILKRLGKYGQADIDKLRDDVNTYTNKDYTTEQDFDTTGETADDTLPPDSGFMNSNVTTPQPEDNVPVSPNAVRKVAPASSPVLDDSGFLANQEPSPLPQPTPKLKGEVQEEGLDDLDYIAVGKGYSKITGGISERSKNKSRQETSYNRAAERPSKIENRIQNTKTGARRADYLEEQEETQERLNEAGYPEAKVGALNRQGTSSKSTPDTQRAGRKVLKEAGINAGFVSAGILSRDEMLILQDASESGKRSEVRKLFIDIVSAKPNGAKLLDLAKEIEKSGSSSSSTGVSIPDKLFKGGF